MPGPKTPVDNLSRLLHVPLVRQRQVNGVLGLMCDSLMAVEMSDASPHPNSRQFVGECYSTMFDERRYDSICDSSTAS